MINFGSVDGVKEKIASLLQIFKGKGSLTFDSTNIDFKISESVSVQIKTPLTLDYENTGNAFHIRFRKPFPIGSFKFIHRTIAGLQFTVDRIDFELNWSPDGYVEVL